MTFEGLSSTKFDHLSDKEFELMVSQGWPSERRHAVIRGLGRSRMIGRLASGLPITERARDLAELRAIDEERARRSQTLEGAQDIWQE